MEGGYGEGGMGWHKMGRVEEERCKKGRRKGGKSFCPPTFKELPPHMRNNYHCLHSASLYVCVMFNLRSKYRNRRPAVLPVGSRRSLRSAFQAIWTGSAEGPRRPNCYFWRNVKVFWFIIGKKLLIFILCIYV